MTNLSLSPLKINLKWSSIMPHLLLLVHLKVHCVTVFTEGNILIEELRKIKSTVQFKRKILSFIRSKENLISKIHDINGLKLLNCLRLHFSHLNEHKFRHNVRATIDPICSRSLEPETTLHYLLRCNLYSDIRTELLNDICLLNPTLKNSTHEKLLNILLYGSENFFFKKIRK